MPVVVSEVFNYTAILNLALKVITSKLFARVAHIHHIHLHNILVEGRRVMIHPFLYGLKMARLRDNGFMLFIF